MFHSHLQSRVLGHISDKNSNKIHTHTQKEKIKEVCLSAIKRNPICVPELGNAAYNTTQNVEMNAHITCSVLPSY